MDFVAMRELIKKRAGLDIRGPAEALLEEAVRIRVGKTESADEHGYYLKVIADEGEFYRLIELLTIKETYFCRDCGQLSFFAEVLAPRLLARPGFKPPLRILSAGCSTGEEVYSIGMVLSERFGADSPALFSLVGCDIDREALAKARAGVYRPFSFRGMEDEGRRRWFEESGEGRWRVKEELANLADFRHVNLLGEKWPEDLGDFDAIFFRNVSIYFDTETRRRIQVRLLEQLRAEGCLIIGSAETLANDLGVFDLREEGGYFYFLPFGSEGTGLRGGAPTRSQTLPSGSASPTSRLSRTSKAARSIPPRRSGAAPPRRTGSGPSENALADTGSSGKAERDLAPSLGDILVLIRERRYGEALASMDEIAAGKPGPDEGLRLLRAFVFLEKREYEAAEGLAIEVLETDPWSTDAFVLLGLCSRRETRSDDAVEWLRQAAYASNDCWTAHFHLAELYRECGQLDKATREYRIVLRALEGGSTRDPGLKIIPLDLPAADLRLLCEGRLRSLLEVKHAP